MNYIKRLEEASKDAKEAREKAMEAIMDLQGYLESPKFSCGDSLDGYVNVKDVLARLAHVREALR